MKIVLLGAPGSGKGTLAKQISKDFNIPQISTGDLFRSLLKQSSPLAESVKEIMQSGGLVPDEITIEIVKERLAKDDCKNGYILDGFPRTINQAKSLEQISQTDIVILVDVSNKTIIDRLSTRRTCLGCGEIYNANSYNKDYCEKCNAPLIQRDDDKPETIKNRLEVYNENTAPLINFYSVRLFKVSNEGEPSKTYQSVKNFLKKWRYGKSE